MFSMNGVLSNIINSQIKVIQQTDKSTLLKFKHNRINTRPLVSINLKDVIVLDRLQYHKEIQPRELKLHMPMEVNAGRYNFKKNERTTKMSF